MLGLDGPGGTGGDWLSLLLLLLLWLQVKLAEFLIELTGCRRPHRRRLRVLALIAALLDHATLATIKPVSLLLLLLLMH